MKRKPQGYYVATSAVGETAQAFIPTPLPPTPAIRWSTDLREKFDHALLALGRLDSVTVFLPDTSLFLRMYVRKEALLSSQIEGTQSTLSDLLLHEIEEKPRLPRSDVQDVSNYIPALNHGLKRLSEGHPLSVQLLRETHKVIRGSERGPGEFRKSQNWIGDARPQNAIFVPPPACKVDECMKKLELFLNDNPRRTPALLKAALAHVQFETIHPFLDGNGRLGRLLVTLLLASEKVLREPILYLSLYFKQHRQQYYELLNSVRFSGDWEAWLSFFADAVTETAEQAVNTAQRLTVLANNDMQKINKLGRVAGSAHRIHRALFERPIVSPSLLQQQTRLSPATVSVSLTHLSNLGIAREITGRKRNRLFQYPQYMEILSEGTEVSRC